MLDRKDKVMPKTETENYLLDRVKNLEKENEELKRAYNTTKAELNITKDNFKDIKKIFSLELDRSGKFICLNVKFQEEESLLYLASKNECENVESAFNDLLFKLGLRPRLKEIIDSEGLW